MAEFDINILDGNASDLFIYWMNDTETDFNNSSVSSNDTTTFYRYETPALVVVVIILALIIFITIIGNVFVITAIVLERSLQVVTNYLILSLAVTDLMVAVLVMPLSLMNEIVMRWMLSIRVCEMWISFDVLLCTASILHLVAISLDRFWAVSNIDYIRNRNAKKILLMVVLVWIVSICISIPPLFGWRDPSNNSDKTGKCLISQDHGYTIFSTLGAFYCPLLLMLYLNYRIFKVARSRIRKKKFGGRNQPQNVEMKEVPQTLVTNAQGLANNRTPNSSGSDADSGVDNFSSVNGSCYNIDEVSCAGSMYDPAEESDELPSRYEEAVADNPDNGIVLNIPDNLFRTTPSTLSPPTLALPGRKRSLLNSPLTLRKKNTGDDLHPPQSKKKRYNNRRKRLKKLEKEKQKKDKMEMRRERKAARVLLIITGAFVFCWLPFFLIAVIAPFCGKFCDIPDEAGSFFLWLGYVNSLLNPIIYTIFNPSFRTAFKKILYGKYRRTNFKLPR